MLKNTFIHIPGVGKAKELEYWKQNILTWSDLLSSLQKNVTYDLFGGISASAENKDIILCIQDSEKALKEKNCSFFSRLLPKEEYWRLYHDFKENCVFVDIETTGLSSVIDDITLIGCYKNGEYQAFVKGKNILAAIDVIQSSSLISTFNGTLFDIKFIQAKNPKMIMPSVHLDLRNYIPKTDDYKGGLKHIEKTLGIQRESDIDGMDGKQAIVWWNQYQQGDNSALDKLIRYNREDTVNLEKLATTLFTQKFKQLFPA